MRLIHRVIIILSAAVLTMLVGNALILHLFVGGEFRSLENGLAVRNADRAADAVSNDLAHLRSSALDWATWDSSYAFMRGDNVEEFIEQNLMLQSFQGIQVNLMYFLRLDGTVMWGAIHDLESGDGIELPEFPEYRLPPDLFALFRQDEVAEGGNENGKKARSGILMTERGPMLVVSAPVHRADGTGDAAGILVMGRFLDGALIEQLGRQVHAPFTLNPVGQRQSPSAVQEPTGEIVADDDDLEGRGPPSVTVDEDRLRVERVLDDIAGKPVLVLETTYARSISAAGNSMVNCVLALMGGVLGVTGLAILLMLNRTVLKPVARLMDRVLEARGITGRPVVEADTEADATAMDGDSDEITILSAEFERTMNQLEETRNRLVEQSFYTGAAELVGGMTHNVRNALTPISIKLWHIGRALDMAHLDKMGAAVGRVAEVTADRPDCALAITYLKACMEHLRASHSTIETDIGVIGDQATQIEQIFYDHERFSRAKRQVETIDVIRVIEEAAKLLQHGDKTGIEIDSEVGRLPSIRGHHIVLTQVFGNLVVNAEEAILAGGNGNGNGSGKGKITIKGRVVACDGSDMVELHFTDDGQGIPEDKLDRIFERGYSTRRAHSGGIGLHWCANSLAGMGGGIWAMSDGVGKGATIVVRLPVKKRVFRFDELRESA
jgi:signal transduction histidine kinase